MQKLNWAVLLVVMLSSHPLYAESDCALLLFPIPKDVPPQSFAARFARTKIKANFPAGLVSPSEMVLGAKPQFSLDAVDVVQEVPLAGVKSGALDFVEVWYRSTNMDKIRQESLVRYSVVQTSDLESRQYWVIEHPVQWRDHRGRWFYGVFNSHQTHPPKRDTFSAYPVIQVERPQDARLAMYLAALFAPQDVTYKATTRWIHPVLKPILISQQCVGEACYTQVQVLASYGRFEMLDSDLEGRGQFRDSFTIGIHTNAGKFVRQDAPVLQRPVDPKLIWALEDIAGEL